MTEARLPIMICTPAQLRETAPPAGVELDVAVDVDALREAAATQNAAYDAPPPTQADVRRLEDIVAAGGVVGLGRELEGRPLASGLVTPASVAFAELAAVGVLPAWRRRGLAAALTGSLGRAAVDDGVDALMLMAYQAEQGIYAPRRLHGRLRDRLHVHPRVNSPESSVVGFTIATTIRPPPHRLHCA